MFIAYIDESGHPSDTNILTIACVVGKERKWIQLTEKWKRVLRRYRVSMFHMTEYENRAGEFEGWQQDKRIAFIADLAAILKNTMTYAVAASLSVEDWKETIGELIQKKARKDRFRYIAPYLMLFQECLQSTAESVKLSDDEAILCIADENNIAGNFVSRFCDSLIEGRPWANKFASVEFANKREIIPLQAADMVAYEAFKYAQRWDEHKNGLPRRKLMQNLAATGCITVGRYTRQDLEGFRNQMIEMEKFILQLEGE
ncbi:MAG: DUF3800 domain-containing protein [Nitrospira sp.]|nr:DUF3800 domain-containing protein [Nitrospira sp.]